jgi:hypothetical protein
MLLLAVVYLSFLEAINLFKIFKYKSVGVCLSYSYFVLKVTTKLENLFLLCPAFY